MFIFQIMDRVYLIGNSLVANLNSYAFYEVISLPGATMADMYKHVLRRRHDLYGSTLYIMEGAIRFTKKITTESRVEVVLRQGRSAPDPIQVEMETIRSELLRRRDIKVVFCQIPAMSIREVNRALESRHGGRQLMKAFHSEWQRELQHSIQRANRLIVEGNERHAVLTPWTTKGSISTNRRFSFRRLADGLHPKPALLRIWAKEFERVVQLAYLPYAPQR